jgi:hypothetical protein
MTVSDDLVMLALVAQKPSHFYRTCRFTKFDTSSSVCGVSLVATIPIIIEVIDEYNRAVGPSSVRRTRVRRYLSHRFEILFRVVGFDSNAM